MAHAGEPIMVCSDCLIFIANGDLTGLDYSPGGKGAEERAAAIIAGCEEWSDKGAHLCATSDEKTDDTFSRRACGVCHDKGPGAGAGSRHQVTPLYNDTMHCKGHTGVPFLVRLVRKGGKYGREDRLTHDESDPLVEFFDIRPAKDGSERRQFVSRYYASTLRRDDTSGGLCLDTGSPSWAINGDTLRGVLWWLANVTEG
jgi:hypothetical protein